MEYNPSRAAYFSITLYTLCRLIKAFTIILFCLCAVGCVSEDFSDCESVLRVRFSLDDSYDPSDFDSRIGNSVSLSIFSDGAMSRYIPIAFADIENYSWYSTTKTGTGSVTVHYVAWTRPEGADTELPSYAVGDSFDGQYIELTPHASITGAYEPFPIDLYLGTVTSVENYSGDSSYSIGVAPCACRIDVRVSDPAGILGEMEESLAVRMSGTMTRMNLSKQGLGGEAEVYTGLYADGDGEYTYRTGTFGVLPSSSEQTLKVDIMNGMTVLYTLAVPRYGMPQGAESGGWIVFEYTIGSNQFTITVGDYTQKFYNVGGI